METEPFQTPLLAAVFAGSAFSGAIGTWRRGLRADILCGLAAATLLAAGVIPFWLTLGDCGLRLTRVPETVPKDLTAQPVCLWTAAWAAG